MQTTNFFQFTSESTRKKIKTKMICMVESLLNEEYLRATSSSDETEETANQDDFFCLNNQKTENKALLNS